MTKLAFVTPRYGPSVIGGAETGARMIAERLAARPGWEVEILTTAAEDHLTWENSVPVGTEEVAGVTVHRFEVAARRMREYFAMDGQLRAAPRAASLEQARTWVALNGPSSPALVDAVASSDADVIAFYPYLFATTVDGIAVARVPTVMHPAAHDEMALYLRSFRYTFGDVDGFVYHTRAERDLVQQVFRVAERPQIELGLGVNAPVPAGRRGGEILGIGDRPYVCYLGRVDSHKGCTMLAEYFTAYKDRHPGDLALAFVGPLSEAAVEHPDIVSTGTVSEADKWDILTDARAMISSSAYESFSLVLLEAWTVGVPVVVNAACAATMEHVTRSGGGLAFDSYRSFEAVLGRLVGDDELRASMGALGRDYTNRHYAWDRIIDRYVTFLDGVRARGRRVPLMDRRLPVITDGTPYERED